MKTMIRRFTALLLALSMCLSLLCGSAWAAEDSSASLEEAPGQVQVQEETSEEEQGEETPSEETEAPEEEPPAEEQASEEEKLEAQEDAVSNTLTYANSTQNAAQLDELIRDALQNGESKIYTSAYDGKGLSAGNEKTRTELLYNRPLYQLRVWCEKIENGKVTFHAEVFDKAADNGMDENAPGYIRGIEYSICDVYYLGENGYEQTADGVSNKKSVDFTIDFSDMARGCNYIRFKLYQFAPDRFNLDEYVQEEPICFNLNVTTLPVSGWMSADKSSITLGTVDAVTAGGNVQENGINVQYRVKGAKSWSKKSFKAGKTIKLTGLKANTIYEWKLQHYMKSKRHDDGSTDTITQDWNSTTTRTGVSSKPAVKSVKCSGIKYTKHQTNGQWVHGTWYPAKTWYTTDYTIKVTFKSIPKGVVGIMTDGNIKCKLSGKTITVKQSFTGKVKGKKGYVNLQTYTNKSGIGLSPKLKYTYTIK